MIILIGFVISFSVVIILCGKAEKRKTEDPPYESIKGIGQGEAISERFRTDDDVGYVRLKFLRNFQLKSARTCGDPLPVPDGIPRISIPTAFSSDLSIDSDPDSGNYQRISNVNKSKDYEKVYFGGDVLSDCETGDDSVFLHGDHPPYSTVQSEHAILGDNEYSVVNRPPIPPARSFSLPDFVPIYDPVYEPRGRLGVKEVDSDNYAKIGVSADYAVITLN